MENKAEKIREYRDLHGCSLENAKKVITRQLFCEEIRSCKSIGALAQTLIEILNFEFGDYNA